MNNKRILIEFQDEFKYRKWVQKSQIDKGNIRNPYEKTIYEVGCLGEAKSSHPLYKRWHGIIRRCYDKEFIHYNCYGGKGVRVSDEWLVFSNFLKDLELMNNYECLCNAPQEYHIDKDKNGGNMYSKDNCIIISTRENEELKSKSIDMLTLDGKLIKQFVGTLSASQETSVCLSSINKCIHGKYSQAGGYLWRYSIN